MKMIIGLGNPGREYADSRHNMGFKVIDCLRKKMSLTGKQRKFASLFSEGHFADKKLVLLKPGKYWKNL